MSNYFDRILPKHRNCIKPVHMKTGLKRHRQLPIFDGVKVEPFPLIVIKDRNRKWVDSLINEVPF